MRHWISLLLIGVALLSTPSHAQRIVDADQIRKPNRAGTLTVPSVSGVISCVSCTEILSNKTLLNATVSGTLTGGTVSGTTIASSVINGASNTISNIGLTTQVTGVLPVANGGTNSSTALNNNRIMRSSGGAIGEAAAITASRALVSDSNGIPTHSAITTTELEVLSGTLAKTSFNPLIIGTTTAGTGTYSVQVGRYAQFGPLVFFSLNVAITAHTGTGNLRVRLDSLPILPNVTNGHVSVIVGFVQNLAVTGSQTVIAYAIPNTNDIDLVQQVPSGAPSAIPMDTNFQLMLSGWYWRL